MLTLELGSEYTLIKTIAPANASNKAVIWHSTNTDVATISESGVIKAISTGKATITTTTVDGGYSASCQLNVVISAKGLTVSPKETALEVGNSHKLSAKINPESATNKNVSWSSSDASVVTVDQEGRITAVQAGVTKIYATTEDGEYTDYCLVTVTGDIPSEMEVPNDSTVIISFSKIEKADRYYVYVYRLENSSQILESTQTLDKSGNLVDEKVNLRAASDLLSTILIRKDKASSYLVKVDAVQSVSGYEVIISTHQSSISNPVANELIPATPTSVIYHEGKLEIMNMNNYMAHIVGIDGKVWDSVQITNDSYYHPLKLAPGIYVFSGVNGKKKVTEKFVVR